MSGTQNAVSPVAGRGWKGLSGWGKVAVATGAVGCLAGLIILPGLGGQTGNAPIKTQDISESSVEAFKQPPRITQTSTAPASPIAVGQPTAHRLPPPLEIGSFLETPQSRMQPQQPAANRYAGNYGTPQGASGGGVTPVYVPASEAGAPAAGPAPSSLEGQTSGALTLRTMTASILPHPEYTITAGAKIPCVTVEAADSTLGGFYSCRVPQWVRGTTMSRGLLPPGSLVFGQMKKGMEQGQERVGILFTRIETAGDHIVIPLAAPAADALGRPGMTGDVETFFWDKVGDVALYALIDGLQGAMTQGASAAISGALSHGSGGNSFINFSGGGGGQSLAAMELQNKINRPPVMHINQGVEIEVSVGQDLDFFAACQQRAQVNPMACPEQ